MTAAPHIISVRCHWCSRQLPPYRVQQLSSSQFLCDHCLEWHNHALALLGGAVPPGCQECGSSWNSLHDSAPGVEVRLYVVPKDGILQVLCARCKDAYVAKRADLYRGTQFGHQELRIS